MVQYERKKITYHVTAPMCSLIMRFPIFSSFHIHFVVVVVNCSVHFLFIFIFILHWTKFNWVFCFVLQGWQFILLYMDANVRLIDFTGLKWNRSHMNIIYAGYAGSNKKNNNQKNDFKKDFSEWISMAFIFFCVQFTLLILSTFLSPAPTLEIRNKVLLQKKKYQTKSKCDFQRNNRTNKHIDCIHLFLNAKQTTIARYIFFSIAFCPACCIVSLCACVYLTNVWYEKASFVLNWIYPSTLLIIPKFIFYR